MPQFELVWFTGEAFWLLVCFGFLYLIVAYMVFPLLQDIFEDRAEAVDKNLEIADSTNKKAADVIKVYNDFILNAKQEKAEIIQSSYQEIQKFVTHAENANNQDMRQQMEKAEDEVRRTQEQAVMKSDAVADDIAQKLVRRLVTMTEK